MKKSADKKRTQVNMNLDDATADLLDAAVQEFGSPRAAIASEVVALALPIYLRIKRQSKSNERDLMERALEIALGKSPAETSVAPPMAERPTRRARGR